MHFKQANQCFGFFALRVIFFNSLWMPLQNAAFKLQKQKCYCHHLTNATDFVQSMLQLFFDWRQQTFLHSLVHQIHLQHWHVNHIFSKCNSHKTCIMMIGPFLKCTFCYSVFCTNLPWEAAAKKEAKAGTGSNVYANFWNKLKSGIFQDLNAKWNCFTSLEEGGGGVNSRH